MNDGDRTDRDLRDLFQAQRQSELDWTPSLERITSRRPAGRRPTRWVFAVAVGATLVLVLAGRILRRDRVPSEAALRLVVIKPGEWRTPTDFLLDVPGTEFLRRVPELGRVNGWFPLAGSAPDRGSRSSRL